MQIFVGLDEIDKMSEIVTSIHLLLVCFHFLYISIDSTDCIKSVVDFYHNIAKFYYYNVQLNSSWVDASK